MAGARKQWLTPALQVQHLKSKGVRFDIMSEADAERYLRENNNYFRLRSYRVGFPKHVGGVNDGKYTNLDFAMLVDLAIIDMHLRNELLPMTLDIEHFSKVRLLDAMEAHNEDGYQIVQDFMVREDYVDQSGNPRNRIQDEIERGLSSPYTRGLIQRHPTGDWPVWEFLEVIPFGRFIHFWGFCANRYGDADMRKDFYVLQSVKGLRNACAHNNCIINDMGRGTPQHPASHLVTVSLAAIGVSRTTRSNKLSNERFIQIASTLYMHQRIASSGVREKRGNRLREFSQRMRRNEGFYVGVVGPVHSGLAFIGKMIEGWYPPQSVTGP